MVSGTKIRLTPYIHAWVLHAAFAAIISALLLGPAKFIPASLVILPALGSGNTWTAASGHVFWPLPV